MGMEDNKPKRLAPAAAMWAQMTPEERAEFIARRTQKIKEGKAKKEIDRLRLKKINEQRTLMRQQRLGTTDDQIAVKEIKKELMKMEDKLYIPSFQVLNAAIQLARSGRDLESIRNEYFKFISQDVWVKFKKQMFSIQVSSPEDVGNDLLVSKNKITSDIRAEINKMLELQKDRPHLYHDKIAKMLSTIHQIESDTAKRLQDIGAVGTKRQGGIAIQIVNYIPRPDKPLAHDKKVSNYITTAPRELDHKGAEDIEILTVPAKEEVKA